MKTITLMLLVAVRCLGQIPTEIEINRQLDSVLIDYNDSILVNHENNSVSQFISKWDTAVFHSRIESISDCFDKEDFDFFVAQIIATKKRKWDKGKFSAIGLKQCKKGETGTIWGFSRPLFTKDRQSFIIQFGNYCGDLCGYGCTYVYKKEKNKWHVWRKVYCWVS